MQFRPMREQDGWQLTNHRQGTRQRAHRPKGAAGAGDGDVLLLSRHLVCLLRAEMTTGLGKV